MKAETASLLDSWESEVQAAWLYRVLAEVETGENKRLFEALSVPARLQIARSATPRPHSRPVRRHHVVLWGPHLLVQRHGQILHVGHDQQLLGQGSQMCRGGVAGRSHG